MFETAVVRPSADRREGGEPARGCSHGGAAGRGIRDQDCSAGAARTSRGNFRMDNAGPLYFSWGKAAASACLAEQFRHRQKRTRTRTTRIATAAPCLHGAADFRRRDSAGCAACSGLLVAQCERGVDHLLRVGQVGAFKHVRLRRDGVDRSDSHDRGVEVVECLLLHLRAYLAGV